ncbi:MAG: Hsp20 family protein [Alphaproteobacteria bacterium]
MNQLVSFTSPLMRQSVGFDRFNDLFETMLNDKGTERFESYPPYNIEKLSEDEYRVVMAVAGFTDKDIDITVQDDTLTVSGKITESEEEEGKTYLHRGIAGRSFERTFRLADHIQVREADLTNGLLSIDLERIVPEEKKPRMIPIKNGKTSLLGGKKSK